MGYTAGFAKDFVEKAEAGIAMEPENADDLIQALLKMKSDPELCQKLGNNAHQNICSKYNRDQQAKDYIIILEHILHPPKTM